MAIVPEIWEGKPRRHSSKPKPLPVQQKLPRGEQFHENGQWHGGG